MLCSAYGEADHENEKSLSWARARNENVKSWLSAGPII